VRADVANYRYKVEGVVDADPETVFSFIDPTPASPRAKWDRAVKELHIIEQLDKAVYNTRIRFCLAVSLTTGYA